LGIKYTVYCGNRPLGMADIGINHFFISF